MMKSIKRVALFLALLFALQAAPINVLAVSLNQPLTGASRGIHVLARYLKEDVGRAGVLYVNEFNQEAIIKRSDASFISNDTQLELIYYYSSYENGYSTKTPYGNHWKTNYDITLQYDAEKKQFLYLRNDGSVVAFEKTNESENGQTYWKEKITMLCRLDKLYVKQNSTDPADARIETKRGETLTFDSEGRLARIQTQKSDVQITYLKNGISVISDADGRRLQFEYGKNNQVETVTYYHGETPEYIKMNDEHVLYQIKYQYDTRGNLVSVTAPNGQSITYEYLSSERLSGIQNIDGKNLEILYAQKKVQSVRQVSSEAPGVSREIVSLNRDKDGTVIKSELFKNTVYQYDEHGLLVYDDNTIKIIDTEVREIEIASEQATAERENPCGCDDCYLVACDCECNMQAFCNCFTCHISASMNGNQKSISKKPAQNSENYLSEKCDSLGTKAEYQYGRNQKLLKVTLELAELTNGIMENHYEYVGDRLVSVANKNSKYDLLYDAWGNPGGIDIEGSPHVRYHYINGNLNYIQTQAYANGQILSYSYDDDGRISSISADHGKTAIYNYDYLKNDVVKITNHTNKTAILSTDHSYEIFDINQNETLFSAVVHPGRRYTLQIGNQSYDVKWQSAYDEEEGKYSLQYQTEGDNASAAVDVIRNYANDDSAAVVTTSSQDRIGNTFTRTLNENNQCVEETLTSIYQYQDESTSRKWTNVFDRNNRLVSVALDDKPYTQYAYDPAGQLIKIRDFISGQTIQYTYDFAGNLTGRIMSPNRNQQKNTKHSYGDSEWKDLLTGCNDRQIVYDEIGNPVSYGDSLFAWTSGRQLKSMTMEQQRIEYTYGVDGLRQSKTVFKANDPAYQYRYFWGGNHLMGFDYKDYLSQTLHTVVFILDNEGTPYGFIVDDNDIYLYDKNIAGDIAGVYHNGNQVARYRYGAYGEVLSCYENEDVKKYNILAYRGYCRDRETDMYYLQSRYYVPEWGRFLNADLYVDTGTGILGTNMFAYCENDPVNYVDPDGFWKIRKDDNSHDKLTKILYEGENYANLKAMIDGNVWVDDANSALIPTNKNQKYHFDRQRQMSEYSEDTRFEMAAYWLERAINSPVNSANEANYIGRAMHSMQDYSSHGNIGIHYSIAAHGINGDNREFIWKDDTLRGSNHTPFFSGIKKTTGTQHRWIEAQDMSVGTIVLYTLLKIITI